MASIFTRRARKDMLSAYLSGATVKAMLVDQTYAPTSAATVVDDGTANDPLSHETTATGYSGGFAGTDRQALTSMTFTEDAPSDEARFSFAAVVWTLLGGAAGLGGVVFYIEGTSDTDSVVVGFDDCSNLTTNGADVTYTPPAGGLIVIGS